MNGITEDYNGSPAFSATMLYVDGSIGTSTGSYGPFRARLRGPQGILTSSGAAIQNNSEVTVTALGDVNITGDITYVTEPVTMPGEHRCRFQFRQYTGPWNLYRRRLGQPQQSTDQQQS